MLTLLWDHPSAVCPGVPRVAPSHLIPSLWADVGLQGTARRWHCLCPIRAIPSLPGLMDMVGTGGRLKWRINSHLGPLPRGLKAQMRTQARTEFLKQLLL